MHGRAGCPAPGGSDSAVRSRLTVAASTTIIANLPVRKGPGGWMVWMESPGNADLEISLDMGRFQQARQFTVPANGFRVFEIPSSSPVKVRGFGRGTSALVDLAAWPVSSVRWSNPEFQTATATVTGAQFAGTVVDRIPHDANRIMVEIRSSIATSVASFEVQGSDRQGNLYRIGNITLAQDNRVGTFEIVPGFIQALALTSTGVAGGETIVAQGTTYRAGR